LLDIQPMSTFYGNLFCPQHKDMTCIPRRRLFDNCESFVLTNFLRINFYMFKNKDLVSVKSQSNMSWILIAQSRAQAADPRPLSQPPHRAAHARDVKHTASYAPMRQIGSRTAANYSVLGSLTSIGPLSSRNNLFSSLKRDLFCRTW